MAVSWSSGYDQGYQLVFFYSYRSLLVSKTLLFLLVAFLMVSPFGTILTFILGQLILKFLFKAHLAQIYFYFGQNLLNLTFVPVFFRKSACCAEDLVKKVSLKMWRHFIFGCVLVYFVLHAKSGDANNHRIRSRYRNIILKPFSCDSNDIKKYSQCREKSVKIF